MVFGIFVDKKLLKNDKKFLININLKHHQSHDSSIYFGKEPSALLQWSLLHNLVLLQNMPIVPPSSSTHEQKKLPTNRKDSNHIKE
jgi:hypothetical protein